jgi:hypothetical protein
MNLVKVILSLQEDADCESVLERARDAGFNLEASMPTIKIAAGWAERTQLDALRVLPGVLAAEIEETKEILPDSEGAGTPPFALNEDAVRSITRGWKT